MSASVRSKLEYSLVTQQKLYNQLEYSIRDAEEIESRTPLLADIDSLLPVLNIAKSMNNSEIDDFLVIYSGLNKSQSVLDGTKEFYSEILRKKMLPLIEKELVFYLNQEHESVNQYEKLLEIYLMFGYPEIRDNQTIVDGMNGIWLNRYEGAPFVVDELLIHLKNLLTNPAVSMSPDKQLISEVRSRLDVKPLWERVYARIKDTYSYKKYDLDINEYIVGFNQIFSNSNLKVNGFYTKQSYFKNFVEESPKAIQYELSKNALYGISSTISTNEMQVLYTQIENKYFEEYTSVWSDLLSSLRLNYKNNLPAFSNMLDKLAQPNSPLIQLIDLVEQNTSFVHKKTDEMIDEVSTSNKMVKALSTLASSYNYSAGRDRVTRFFVPYHRFNDDESIQLASFNKGLIGMKELSDSYLFLDDQSVKHHALLNLKKIVKHEKNNAVSHLFHDSSDPYLLEKIKKELNRNFVKINLNKASDFINEKFNNDVYEPFDRLMSGKYPIYVKSKLDVDLKDFEAFYMRNGIFDDFFYEYVAPFSICTASKCKNRPLYDDLSFAFKDHIFDLFAAVKNARTLYFNRKANKLDLDVAFKVVQLDSAVKRFSLKYNNNIYNYRHGPVQSHPLKWPSSNNYLVMSIFGLNQEFLDYDEFDGGWSLWRALNSMSSYRYENRSRAFKFEIEGYEARIVFESNKDISSVLEFRLSTLKQRRKN